MFCPNMELSTVNKGLLFVSDPPGDDLVDFYKTSFGAEQMWLFREDGKIVSAGLKIGSCKIYIHEVAKEKITSFVPIEFETNVDDVRTFKDNAVAGGAKVVKDGRNGPLQVTDPFGISWIVNPAICPHLRVPVGKVDEVVAFYETAFDAVAYGSVRNLKRKIDDDKPALVLPFKLYIGYSYILVSESVEQQEDEVIAEEMQMEMLTKDVVLQSS